MKVLMFVMITSAEITCSLFDPDPPILAAVTSLNKIKHPWEIYSTVIRQKCGAQPQNRH